MKSNINHRWLLIIYTVISFTNYLAQKVDVGMARYCLFIVVAKLYAHGFLIWL